MNRGSRGAPSGRNTRKRGPCGLAGETLPHSRLAPQVAPTHRTESRHHEGGTGGGQGQPPPWKHITLQPTKKKGDFSYTGRGDAEGSFPRGRGRAGGPAGARRVVYPALCEFSLVLILSLYLATYCSLAFTYCFFFFLSKKHKHIAETRESTEGLRSTTEVSGLFLH